MNKLLTIEWMIWSKHKLFMLMFFLWLIFMVGFPSFIYLFYYKHNSVQVFNEAFSFPLVFNTISVFELLSTQILSVLLIIIICHEFESETYKNQIIFGFKRVNLLMSKLLLAFVLSFLVLAFSIVISLVIGWIEDGEMQDISINLFRWNVYLMYQSFAYFIFAISISYVVKNTGLSIVIYTLWFGLFERLIARLLNESLNLSPVGSLLPGKTIEDLSNLLVFKNISIYNLEYNYITFIFSLGWIVLFLLIGYYSLKKSKL